MSHNRIDFLGVPVSEIDMRSALETIESWIVRKDPNYVCIRDVHGVMLSRSDAKLREIHESAGMVTPDGMPLVWLGRLRGFSKIRRVCGSDLMLELCRRSVTAGYSHFFYGGAPGCAKELEKNLRSCFPGLKSAGTYCPPFRPLTARQDRKIVQLVETAAPDILWVGLSTPKQEHWMAAHVGQLSVPVMIGVGAAFDIHSGRMRRAPVWMRRTSLEWLFRLLSEPRRLWRRYIVMAPLFLVLVALDGLGLRKGAARARS